MAEEPKTTLSEIITAPTEEKKPETVTETNPQTTSEEKKEENIPKEPAKKIEATPENKEQSILIF